MDGLSDTLYKLHKGGMVALFHGDKGVTLLVAKNLLEAISRHINNNPKIHYNKILQLETSADVALVQYHVDKYCQLGYEVNDPRNTKYEYGWVARLYPYRHVEVFAKTTGKVYYKLGEFSHVDKAKEYIAWLEESCKPVRNLVHSLHTL